MMPQASPCALPCKAPGVTVQAHGRGSAARHTFSLVDLLMCFVWTCPLIPNGVPIWSSVLHCSGGLLVSSSHRIASLSRCLLGIETWQMRPADSQEFPQRRQP